MEILNIQNFKKYIKESIHIFTPNYFLFHPILIIVIFIFKSIFESEDTYRIEEIIIITTLILIPEKSAKVDTSS